MDRYKIAETENFAKKIASKKFNRLYQKIYEDIYPMLRNNPFYGVNIKKLKGEFREIYRFRTGNYRLFYTIVEKESIVFIIDIESRQDSYK